MTSRDRVPAVEILIPSAPARQMILDAQEHELEQIMKADRDEGMQTLTDSLVELVRARLIHPNAALAAASKPDEVRMRLRGISSEAF